MEMKKLTINKSRLVELNRDLLNGGSNATVKVWAGVSNTHNGFCVSREGVPCTVSMVEAFGTPNRPAVH